MLMHIVGIFSSQWPSVFSYRILAAKRSFASKFTRNLLFYAQKNTIINETKRKT